MPYVISASVLASVAPDPSRAPDRLSARWFASAADRAAFAEELATAVTGLIGKYHDESANGGREHRVIVAVHPSLKPKVETERKEP